MTLASTTCHPMKIRLMLGRLHSYSSHDEPPHMRTEQAIQSQSYQPKAPVMVLSSLDKDIRAAELALDWCENNAERIRVLRMIPWIRSRIIGDLQVRIPYNQQITAHERAKILELSVDEGTIQHGEDNGQSKSVIDRNVTSGHADHPHSPQSQ
eukprot:10433626-Karenia_brevis.AAC.1